MTLRRTILGVIGLTFFSLATVLLVSLRSFLLPHFRDEENRAAILNVQRVTGLLDSQFYSLEQSALAWSRSDEMYALVQARGVNSLLTGLDSDVQANQQLNLVAILDLDGRVLYQRVMNPRTGQVERLSAEWQAHFQTGDRLLRTASESEPVKGFVALQSGPWMVISAPVLRADGGGPAAGTLLVARLLDSSLLTEIAGLARFPLTLQPFAGPEISAEFLALRPQLEQELYAVQPVSEIQINGYALLKDLYGSPAYILRVEQSRSISKSGQIVMTYLGIALVMAAILFSAMTFLLVDRLVLSRVALLSREVSQIGRNVNQPAKVSVSRRDELSRLAENINQMLQRLDRVEQMRRESEEQFRRVVEAMDDTIFILDRDLTHLKIYGKNVEQFGLPDELVIPAGESFLEIDPQQVKVAGENFGISPGTLRAHQEAVQSAMTGEHFTYEWLARINSRLANIHTALSPLPGEDGEIVGIVGVSRDITDLKMLEAVLRQKVQDLSILYEGSQAFLSRLDTREILQASCRLLVENLGAGMAWLGEVSADENWIQPVAAYGAVVDDLPLVSFFWQEQPGGHPAVRVLRDQKEVLICGLSQHLDSGAGALSEVEQRFASLLALPVSAAEQSPKILCVFSLQEQYFSEDRVQLLRAFTNLVAIALQNAQFFEQVRADQERLQNLSRRLVEIQEDERRQIAQELHDEIGQLLTGLKLQIDIQAENALPVVQPHIQRSRELLDDLIHKVRQMSLDLRPSMLDDLGLLPALLWHFDRYTSLTQIKVQFYHSGVEDRRFAPQVEISAYRIIQEALTNAARYAGVSEVSVNLTASDSQLTLQIEDEGKGFSPAEVIRGGQSRGLIGIQERVAYLNGELTIDSVPGWGTSLLVELPIPNEIRSAD